MSGILSNSKLVRTRTYPGGGVERFIASPQQAVFSGMRDAYRAELDLGHGAGLGAPLPSTPAPAPDTRRRILATVRIGESVLTSAAMADSAFSSFSAGMSAAVSKVENWDNRTLVFMNHRDTSKALADSMGPTWPGSKIPPSALSSHPHARGVRSAETPVSLRSAYGRDIPTWPGRFKDGILPSSDITFTWREEKCTSLPMLYGAMPPGDPARREWLQLLACWVDLLVTVPLASLGMSGFAESVAAAGGPGVFYIDGHGGAGGDEILNMHYLSAPPFWARSHWLAAFLIDQAAFAANTMDSPAEVVEAIDYAGGPARIEQAASGKNTRLARDILPKVSEILASSNKALWRPRCACTPPTVAMLEALTSKEANLQTLLPQVNGSAPERDLRLRVSASESLSKVSLQAYKKFEELLSSNTKQFDK